MAEVEIEALRRAAEGVLKAMEDEATISGLKEGREQGVDPKRVIGKMLAVLGKARKLHGIK